MNRHLLACLLLWVATSAIYSVNDRFEVSFDPTYDELAHVSYEQRIFEKGWNYLHAYGNPRKGLLDQHRGAGFLEGYVTYSDIYAAYLNLCGSIIQSPNLNEKVQAFVDEQLDYIDRMVAAHPMDLYWQYASAKL